jgi:PIN domain nuclease of toxin-antitoxin system
MWFPPHSPRKSGETSSEVPAMMLLDTHVVLWLALDPAKLSKRAKVAIEETRQHGDDLAISDITLLEIATLVRKGRIQLNSSLETLLVETEARFVVLPMTGRVCVQAIGLPPTYPKDLADRIIGATALVQGVSLITADSAIRDSRAVRTIW